MWTREDLKMRGKFAFRKNYWTAVLVAFVMSLFETIGAGSSAARGMSDGYNSGSTEAVAISLVIAAVAMLGSLIAVILSIFVGSALEVSGCRFFITNQSEQAQAGTLAYAFKCGNYGNVILVMFLKDLYTILWSLLFVIPGIVKSYEYCMVPYILAENPGMNRKEAFLISKRMMMGQKWNTFVLDLSFIGWRILEAITFGILGIFYVEPYVQATYAELYAYNRSIAYQNGYIR